MVGETQNFDRKTIQRYVRPPSRQDGLHLGPLPQPRDDLLALLVAGCIEINFRPQAVVQPVCKCAAEALDHGTDADIHGEREQQRHQRQ